MIQSRRLAALLLGAWLGASILADVAVTQNFQTVDRFLAAPGSPATSLALNEIGRAKARVILRRNAGEENNWIFLNWERVEFFVVGALFCTLLFGGRPQKMLLAGALVLLAILASEHFLLTPRITDLGRMVDDLPKDAPETRTFWALHGLYSGVDILKMLVGFAMAVRLVVRWKPDTEKFAREYERANAIPGTPSRTSA